MMEYKLSLPEIERVHVQLCIVNQNEVIIHKIYIETPPFYLVDILGCWYFIPLFILHNIVQFCHHLMCDGKIFHSHNNHHFHRSVSDTKQCTNQQLFCQICTTFNLCANILFYLIFIYFYFTILFYRTFYIFSLSTHLLYNIFLRL